MATTTRFKQINAFASKFERVGHAAHLSWMQRFQERVQTLIVTELGEDCPAMIVSQNTALVAAVQAEDEAYRINYGFNSRIQQEVRVLPRDNGRSDARTP